MGIYNYNILKNKTIYKDKCFGSFVNMYPAWNYLKRGTDFQKIINKIKNNKTIEFNNTILLEKINKQNEGEKNYKTKYLKYKNKYLKLKNKL